MRRLSRLLLVLLVFGIMFTGFGVTGIIDNNKPVIPYESLTEAQLKHGAVVSGSINSNLGAIAEEYSTRNGIKSGSSSYYYAILVGSKVMAFKTSSATTKSQLDTQADRMLSSLESLADLTNGSAGKSTEDNNSKQESKKKNSKKNKKKNAEQKEAEQEAAADAEIAEALSVPFKGKVSKMDDDVARLLKEFLTPTGESQPLLEISPYVVSSSMMSMKGSIGFLIAGIACLLITVLAFLRMRR